MEQSHIQSKKEGNKNRGAGEGRWKVVEKNEKGGGVSNIEGVFIK